MDQLFGQQRAEINRQAEEILKAKKALRGKKDKENQNKQQVPPVQQAQVVVTTTSDLRDRWPFLFVPSGMLMHFTKLTDINLEEKFGTFMDSKLEKIVEFMLATNSDKKKKSVKKNMDRAIEELGEDSSVPAFAAAMLLLIQRFKENKKALWLMVDEHVEESEISANVELPPTPCLIIQGTTIFTEKTVYFSMDGQLLGTATGFPEGIAMLLASYFVFNLEFAAEAQITLEFLQRVVAEINPQRGNKRPAKASGGRTSTKMVHHILTQFNDKYDDFRAESSSSDEDSE